MKALNLFVIGAMGVLLALPLPAHAAEVLATTLLKKGTVLTDADIEINTDVDEEFAETRTAYIGQELKRTIYAGHKIARAHIGAPILVKRNMSVTMVYRHGTMKLTAKGRAMSAGALGDTITIMNLSSRKKVYGTVSGPEMVEVTQ